MQEENRISNEEIPEKIMRERRETRNFNVKNCPESVYDKFKEFADIHCAGYFALAISKLLDYKDYSQMAHTLMNKIDQNEMSITLIRDEIHKLKDSTKQTETEEVQKEVEHPQQVYGTNVIGGS